MPRFASEFKVVAGVFMPEHYAVKAIMVFELTEQLKAQSIAIKMHNCREIIRCSRDPQVRGRHSRRIVHRLIITAARNAGAL
jgi:hypothetical protein